MRYRFPLGAILAPAFALVACQSDAPTPPRQLEPSAVSAVRVAGDADLVTWLRRYVTTRRHRARRNSGGPPVLAGAGDIARCYPGSDVTQFRAPNGSNPAMQTARLLEAMPNATVMAVGDNAYEFGSPVDYAGCYDPTWGRFRDRTRPATGNHEYLTPGAAGYFGYFGARAAPPLGYYSYDLGAWHVVVINSTTQVYACWPPEATEIPPGFPSLPPPLTPGPAAGRACAGDVAQQAWLAADLASHRDAKCTVAYFHHPRFSSGMHGNHYQMQKIWDIMYAGGVDIVVSGHDHMYERFAPQDPEARADPSLGIRQFTVGTGGAEFYSVSTRQPNSEVLINDKHGVLALALGDGTYAWTFETVDRSIADAGSGRCH
jgi:acid phosphatase type 7